MTNKRTNSPHGDTLAQQWESFRRQILVPAGAGHVQVMETRRAFYAGASAFFDLALRFDDDDDKAAAQLSAINDEMEAFSKQIGKTA